jgi:hypothetical protein
MQTTVICGLGLMVMAVSGFLPTQRFALMMVGLLSAALVGDLILLPALLLSPMGRFFTGNGKYVLVVGGTSSRDAA